MEENKILLELTPSPPSSQCDQPNETKIRRRMLSTENMIFSDKLITELKPSIVTSPPSMSGRKEGATVKKMTLKTSSNQSVWSSTTEDVSSAQKKENSQHNAMKTIQKSSARIINILNQHNQTSAPATHSAGPNLPSHRGSGKLPRRKNMSAVRNNSNINNNNTINTNSIDISSEFIQKNSANAMATDDANADSRSNMFLYIDLHGHASKKGIFMYGNHLPNVNEAVECMLLPRLMSMNCHHFHFDACVFSERNMYHK